MSVDNNLYATVDLLIFDKGCNRDVVKRRIWGSSDRCQERGAKHDATAPTSGTRSEISWRLRFVTAQHSLTPNYKLNMSQSDGEDDYMNMVFEDAPKGPKFETSLQRAARKRKEVRF